MNNNKDDIDLKGDLYVIMTQGRKTISQIVIPKEMPFINALRYMTLNIYPTRKTYSKDCKDIVAHDCDG